MKLADYLAAHEMTNESFSKLLGTSQPTVSRYVTGKRVPRPRHLRRITELTKGQVTANDFLSEACAQPERAA